MPLPFSHLWESLGRHPWRAGWFGLALLLTLGVGYAARSAGDGVIEKASVTYLGEQLTARAALNPSFQRQILDLLHQGEPLLAEYRFRFYQVRELLPDWELADVTIRRRVRFQLVTQRYSLEDPDRQQVFFTTDADEALSFFAQPRYIVMPGADQVTSGPAYQLQAVFRLEHEGVSRMFRNLNRWLTFWEPSDHVYVAGYRHT